MDRFAAQASAERYLEDLAASMGDELSIVPDATVESAVGWVFFYNTKAYLSTRNSKHALIGNGPLLVDRRSGTVIQLGTAHPIDDYLAHYARTGNVLGR